jgi:fructuronate reductase
VRGHTTVDQAMEDPQCRAAVELWWDEVQPHLDLDDDEVAHYRGRLVQRFSNRRMRHELAQISADGSEKLVARVVPILLAERRAGRAADAACLVLGAWVAFLHHQPHTARDPKRETLMSLMSAPDVASSVPGLLAVLDPRLAADPEVVHRISAAATGMAAMAATGTP